MNAKRSVLVTGGNGFIGQHLVRRLICDGYEVSLLQRSHNQVDPRAKRVNVPVLDVENLRLALSGRRYDWVFHLAGYGVRPSERDVESMFRINVDVTRTLVDLASQWSPLAVVIAGSGSEYNLDEAHEPVTEDHPLEPYKLYGASKAAGTLCSAALATSRRIPFAACRIFYVYGPGEAPHRLLPSLMRKVSSGDRIPLSSGLQKRDFVFIDDVLEALVRVAITLEKDPRQHILNVATGLPVSVREFAQTAARILAIPEERLGFGDQVLRGDEPMMFSGDPAFLNSLTGWKAVVPLADGIRRCLDLPGSQLGLR